MLIARNNSVDFPVWEQMLSLYIFYVLFFYGIINQKHLLTKYYNHQEQTYFYQGRYKNAMFKQKLMEKITKLNILKEKRMAKK